jgi:hypothetical protein
MTGFAVYGTATAHLLSAGTDASSVAVVVLVIASLVALVFLVTMRVPRPRRPAGRRTTGPVPVAGPS